MKTSEILRAAADKLRGGHWIQGRMSDSDSYETSTCFCALGALCAVGKELGISVRRALNALRTLVSGYPFGPIAAWNDDPSRTEAEVVAAFEAAAAAAEKEGR